MKASTLMLYLKVPQQISIIKAILFIKCLIPPASFDKQFQGHPIEVAPDKQFPKGRQLQWEPNTHGHRGRQFHGKHKFTIS